MVFTERLEKRSDISGPGERTSISQVICIEVVVKCFNFKRIVAVGNVMALTTHPGQHIEKAITNPVKDEQHFDLLPEVYFFMANQLRLVVGLAGDPDKNEKR